jgi:GTP pyrophosphokinase
MTFSKNMGKEEIDDIFYKKQAIIVQEWEGMPLKALLKKLCDGFREYSQEDISLLEKAFEFGKRIHAHQKRDTGAPYFTHPLIAALLLLPYKPDRTTLVATLLHDTVEDSLEPDIREQVRNEFGEEILQLVEGVSKVKKMNKAEQQQATLQKIFAFAEKDVRIVVIKLADRVHNILTLGGKKNPAKRIKKAKETMGIFVPIAARLGLWEIRNILEHQCFLHLHPEEDFSALERILHDQKQQLIKDSHTVAQTFGLSSEKVTPVLSHFMEAGEHFLRNETFAPEHTFYIEICTESVAECYHLFSRLSKKYTGKTEELIDYITAPRENEYQALHATFITDNTKTFRLHILTEEMKERSEKGIFLHLREGEYKGRFQNELSTAITSEEHFLQEIQTDILKEKMNIFVENEGRKFLPLQATVLDALFFFFPDQARFVRTIFVNGKKADFGQPLKNNDTLRVYFGQDSRVSLDWMFFLRTVRGKVQLQHILQKEQRIKKIRIGEDVLQKEFDRFGYGDHRKILRKCVRCFKRFNVSSPEELCILVAEGIVFPAKVLETVFQRHSSEGIWKRICRFFGFFSLLPSLKLKIKGVCEEGDDIVQTLHGLAKKQQVRFRKLVSCEKPGGEFCITAHVYAKERKNVDGFFLRLQNQKGIGIVSPLISPLLLGKLLGMLGTFVGGWGIFLWFFFQNFFWGEHMFAAYIVAIPLLLFHFFFYHFILFYFPIVRKNPWFVFAVFGGNTVLFALCVVLLFLHQGEGLNISIFFPLTLLLISFLGVVGIFIRRRLQYSEVTKNEALSPEEWQKRKREKMMGYLIRFGAVVIWGLLPIYIKYTEANSVDPLLRVFFAGVGGVFPSLLIILIISFFLTSKKKKNLYKLPINLWLAALIIGEIFVVYFSNSSLVYTSSTNLILLKNFGPVLALIVALILWRERISYLKQNKNLLSIILIFLMGSIGSSLLFYNDIKESQILYLYGDLLAVLAMVADTFLVISQIQYARYLRKNQSSVLNLYMYLGIAIVASPLVFFVTQNILTLSLPQIVFSIGIGVLSGFGQILNYEAFRRIDGFIAFLMFNMAILITFIAEAVFLGTVYPTLLLLLGGSMIIGASVVAEKINSKCEKQGL